MTDTGRAGQAGWPPPLSQVEAAQTGDRDALGDILRQGFPKLVAFYRGMGLARAEAEDVASEAVVGMVKGIGSLREPGAFEGWFWTIARNRVRTQLRRRGRVVYEKDQPSIGTPEDLVVIGEEHGQIRVALSYLSTRERELLWLREVEGLAHEEIAGRLGMAAGAVRVACLRARRKLEEAYTRLEPSET